MLKIFHYNVRKYILWNEGLIFAYSLLEVRQKFWFVNVGFIPYHTLKGVFLFKAFVGLLFCK
jgi:hypothetical protein